MPDQIRKWALSGIGISVIAGIILSILSPYQTGQFSFSFRLLYWTGLCFIGGLGAGVFEPLARKTGISSTGIPRVIGQSVTASLAVSACLLALDKYRGVHIEPRDAFILFGFVWVVSITIASIAHLAEKANMPSELSKQRAQIYDRLKPALRRGEIYALMAEDHYVRVITSNGDELILMRLSDAVKELADLRGLLVHRSWWVAEAAVKTAKKTDGKITLELLTGQTVPVSRSKAKIVKEAGWI